MSAPSSSATNSDSDDSPSNQPLLNSTSDDSSPVESNQVKSEEQHYSSPKINIGHVYVYNFSPAQPVDTVIEFPSPTDAIVKTKQVISPAASSGPFCRICHEGDLQEDLLSPCFCTGTVGLVHLSCVEKWLSTSGSDKCEICHYAFATVRHPKSFSEWLQSTSSASGQQRTLWGDVTCFLLLTPLAAVSSFLSIDGALKQIRWQNSLEAGSLVALATFLITVYFVWSMLTFRFHLKCYLKWRQKNHHVKILMIRKLSSTDGRFLSNKKPTSIHHSVGVPLTHRPSHARLNIPSSTSGPINSNDVEANTANETNSNENGVSPYPQYDFNRSDFIDHLTAMFETAL